MGVRLLLLVALMLRHSRSLAATWPWHTSLQQERPWSQSREKTSVVGWTTPRSRLVEHGRRKGRQKERMALSELREAVSLPRDASSSSTT